MYEENQGSYNAFIKAGFKLEGIHRKQYILKDSIRSNLLNVGMLKSEFKEADNE